MRDKFGDPKLKENFRNESADNKQSATNQNNNQYSYSDRSTAATDSEQQLRGLCIGT